MNKSGSNPLFSIVIPIYKVEKYLIDCLESVLSQDYEDYEILLIDDGSPDSCPQICDGYALKYNNITVIHKENGGLSDARNCGIINAKGKYIVCIDSDDYWDNVNLLKQLENELINSSYPDVVMFQGKKLFEESGKVVDDNRYDVNFINSHNVGEVLSQMVHDQSYSMSACTKAVKKEILIKKDIFFKKGLLGEDLDWFLNLVRNIKSIKAIEQCCYVYRIRSGSISTSPSPKLVSHVLETIGIWYDYYISDSTKVLNNACLSALAYAYMVALLNYAYLNKADRKLIYIKLKSLKKVMRFATNKKSRITSLFLNCFGINFCSTFLKLYYNRKKR